MTTTEIEHPDVTALNAVYAALGKDHGEQTVLDIVNRIFNAGVVFRMAHWWLDEHALLAPEPSDAEVTEADIDEVIVPLFYSDVAAKYRLSAEECRSIARIVLETNRQFPGVVLNAARAARQTGGSEQ